MSESSSVEDSNSAAQEWLSDLETFRARRSAAPLLPYECLDMNPRHLSRGYRERLERQLDDGYARDGSSVASLAGSIDWFNQERSFAVRLHGWDPITEFLMGHSEFGDERFLALAQKYIAHWLNEVQRPAYAVGPAPQALNTAFGPMPWYDMAVGRRAYRLAYVIDVLVRDERVQSTVIADHLESLIFHLELLSREDFFQAQHNHGFYQAFGELAAARRFRDEPFFAERFAAAKDRVRAIVEQQFHSGGIHREHSPEYHFMVMGSLISARSSGLIADDDVRAQVARIEDAMSWLIQPNGYLVTFGDTVPKNMHEGEYYPDRFEHPALRYQLSQGRLGTFPTPGVRVMPDAGYIFARSEPAQDWWYLAQMASFASRVHKHADDLSFVWSDLGTEILIDPGRYAYGKKTPPDSDLAKWGFWYSDPKRIYVESTRAHNTIEIDGHSYNRKRKPYGSALTYAGEQNGLTVTECDLRHPKSARHWRVLVMNPSRFLLVVDWLFDRAEQVHDFRQHFHFHPDWDIAQDLVNENGEQILVRADRPDLRLTVLPLKTAQGSFTAIRGQEEPELLGWYSDKPYSLIPCTTIVSAQLRTDYAVFATLFTFGTEAEPAPKKTVVRKSMRPSIFSWKESGHLMQIEIRRGQDGAPVKVELHQ